MKISIGGVFLCSLAALSACDGTQSSAPAAAPAAPEVLATTRQIMLGITIPTSDVVFQVGAKEPANDQEWEKVEANAISLAESGVLLTMGSRAVDRQEWLKHSRDLIESAKAAAAAAREKNVDKVLEVGNTIYEVCDACHKKYMPARQGEADPEAAPAGEATPAEAAPAQ